MSRTKIIATLGPSTDDEDVLRKMFVAGVDMVRLNFSHGKREEHTRRVKLIRKINRKLKRTVKLMQDLEGYRIRVGKLKENILLKNKTTIYLTQEKTLGEKKLVPFDYQGSLRGIKKGNLIYIDDGKIILKVKDVEKRRIKALVIRGGILKERKGINISGAKLSFPSLTEKDRVDLEVAIQYKFDCLAQSFVRTAKDIKIIKSIFSSKYPPCKIFAKIENKDALTNLDEIIAISDGILIARGDLGICLPLYKIPIIQKEIIRKCKLAGKPVIVATQMLESMTEEVLPTRAEVSDVANAILDGATHLLLSSETAIGKHPHRVVAMMEQIIKSTESYIKKLKELYLI